MAQERLDSYSVEDDTAVMEILRRTLSGQKTARILISHRDIAELAYSSNTEARAMHVLSQVIDGDAQCKGDEVNLKVGDFRCEEIRHFLRDLDNGKAASSDARETVEKLLNEALSKSQPDGLSMQERFAAQAAGRECGGVQ